MAKSVQKAYNVIGGDVMRTFHFVIRPGDADEGGYWTSLDTVDGGINTQGETLDEIIWNLSEAVACHLGLEDNEPLDEAAVQITYEVSNA
ncbi:MAG: type II toxin-antitoxin system HicB family antitoxin [Oscillospiraceae bacterium]|nr:type II toxin-antitoxin system HicB family antitoxin [Oscillospiraceae bacterium]